jgi:hypothetical protein
MAKHTPVADQRELIDRWRRSALSKAAFARAHGVLPATFAAWVARHTAAALTPAPYAFVEVRSQPVPAAGFVVRVNAQSLTFDAPPPPAWFAELLRELAPC